MATAQKITIAPIHPGEILREEFLTPLGMSAGALARALHVPRTRIERLVKEEVDLSADTALRLARYFGTSAEMWANLQARYEIETARDAKGEDIEAIQPRDKAAA